LEESGEQLPIFDGGTTSQNQLFHRYQRAVSSELTELLVAEFVDFRIPRPIACVHAPRQLLNCVTVFIDEVGQRRRRVVAGQLDLKVLIRGPPATLLVLLAATARAPIVPADLGSLVTNGRVVLRKTVFLKRVERFKSFVGKVVDFDVPVGIAVVKVSPSLEVVNQTAGMM
jgi:hypothetical protein